MKMQKRRSLATTVRLSLLAGAGALGWMALGATGASATQTPTDTGSIGSLSGTMESAGTPVSSILSGVPEPLPTVTGTLGPIPGSSITGPIPAGLPPVPDPATQVPDLAAQVPHLPAQPAGTAAPPAVPLIGEVMEQVPIVNDLVPPGVVTDGLAPVLDTINGATGGVTQPVLKVVGPVTQVIDPVVDVVVSAPESIPPAPALPVPAIPVHAGPVIPPAVVDVLPGEVSASAVHVAAAAPVPVVTATQTVTSDADFSQPTRNLNTASAAQFLTFPQGSIKSAAVPVPAGLAQIGHDFGGLLTVPLTSAGGALSFMTGAGSAEPLTAVTAGTFLIFLMVKEPAHPSVTAGMPAGPSFDPGSSPD